MLWKKFQKMLLLKDKVILMTTKQESKATANNPKVENRFSKEQLLAAKRFQERTDIVNAVLEKFSESETFTVETVERMIEKYMKGRVK